MKERKVYWKNCKGCGTRFAARKRNQAYCKDSCRVEYYARHYFLKVEVEKQCPNCGDIFVTTKPKRQIYCKAECREEAKVKRIEAEGATYFSERYATFEKDGFKCTVCGRGAPDGARLDVYQDEATLKTICTDCKAGKEAKGVPRKNNTQGSIKTKGKSKPS